MTCPGKLPTETERRLVSTCLVLAANLFSEEAVYRHVGRSSTVCRHEAKGDTSLHLLRRLRRRGCTTPVLRYTDTNVRLLSSGAGSPTRSKCSSEKAQAKHLLKRDGDWFTTNRQLHLGHDEWLPTTLVYDRKKDSERTDYGQYVVIVMNKSAGTIREYSARWEIESRYKRIKRSMAATTSKNFVLRSFYFTFACLLYSVWRTVDLLVQVELTGEYERSPAVTANTVLTLLKE